MVFCTGCGKELHETAPFCPRCGKPHKPPFAARTADVQGETQPLWAAIASLVLGVICMLVLLDDSAWDRDTIVGLGMFAGFGFLFGVVSLSISRKGKAIGRGGHCPGGHRHGVCRRLDQLMTGERK